MKKSVASRHLLDKIRNRNGIRNPQIGNLVGRRLVVEAMERRVLLASDLILDSVNESSCPAMETSHEQVSLIQFSTVPLEQTSSDFPAFTPLVSASLAASSVVGSSAFFDSTAFLIGGAGGDADSGKQLAFEGAEPKQLAFSNVLNNTLGITGVRFVFSNLPSNLLETSDFHIQVSPTGLFDQSINPPSLWEAGPTPISIEVSEPDSSLNRNVSLRWEVGAIQNRWLRISVLANENTGLVEPAVYYLGHLLGKVHDDSGDLRGHENRGNFIEVNGSDLKSTREQVGNMALPSNLWDINKDGVVSFRDIHEVRLAIGNQLPLITIPPAEMAVRFATIGDPLLDDSFGASEAGKSPQEIDGIVAEPVIAPAEVVLDPSAVSAAADTEVKDEVGSEEDSAAQRVLLSESPASVVGAFVYHRNSGLAGSGMSDALDTSKQLALETSLPTALSVLNLSNSSRGINGLVFDLLDMPGQSLNSTDFVFQFSPTGAFDELANPPGSWELAPNPEEISVNKDLQTGVSRVSVHFADNSIMNRWLRITLVANSSTGLAAPVVYFIGHLEGKSTGWLINVGASNPNGVFEVDAVDMVAIREQVGQNVGAGNDFDVNKDGVISFADISAMRDAVGLRLSNIAVGAMASTPLATTSDSPSFHESDSLSPEYFVSNDLVVSSSSDVSQEQLEVGSQNDDSAPIVRLGQAATSVVGAYVYHRNSLLAGKGTDGALDNSKQLALESSLAQTLTVQNLINSSRGINGLVFDLLNMPGTTLSLADFQFQVSPTGAFHELNNPANNWEAAPAPEEITVNQDTSTGVSRVNIHWADNSIMNRWLRITILENSSTGLAVPTVYYIGHLEGKSTGWLNNFGVSNPSGVYEVDTVDMVAIREQVGQTVGAGNIYDVNKDGVISFGDISAMREAVGLQLSNITIATVSSAEAAPAFSAISSSMLVRDAEAKEDHVSDSETYEATDCDLLPEQEETDSETSDVSRGKEDEQVLQLISLETVDLSLISVVEEMQQEFDTTI